MAQVLSGIPGSQCEAGFSRTMKGASAEEGRSLSGADVAKRIGEFDYEGGHDNVGALVRGSISYSSSPNPCCCGIHGPQPVLLETEEALLQRLSRGPRLSKWYALQVVPGPQSDC